MAWCTAGPSVTSTEGSATTTSSPGAARCRHSQGPTKPWPPVTNAAHWTVPYPAPPAGLGIDGRVGRTVCSQLKAAARARPAWARRRRAPSSAMGRPGRGPRVDVVGGHQPGRRRPHGVAAHSATDDLSEGGDVGADTGVPCAMASRTGSPKPSWRLGRAKRVGPGVQGPQVGLVTGPSSRTRSAEAASPDRRPGQVVRSQPADRPGPADGRRPARIHQVGEGADQVATFLRGSRCRPRGGTGLLEAVRAAGRAISPARPARDRRRWARPGAVGGDGAVGRDLGRRRLADGDDQVGPPGRGGQTPGVEPASGPGKASGKRAGATSCTVTTSGARPRGGTATEGRGPGQCPPAPGQPAAAGARRAVFQPSYRTGRGSGRRGSAAAPRSGRRRPHARPAVGHPSGVAGRERATMDVGKQLRQ